jgi:tape measure domain-containing protein
MPTDITSLVLAVDSRQVRTASADLDRLTSAGRRTEGATQSLASSFRGLSGVLSGAVAADVLRRVVQTADAYQVLRGRLALVTKTEQERARVLENLFNLTQQTRQSLQGTADLYIKLSQATEGMNVSEQKRLDLTEAVNRALQISGASQQAAQAAVTQLSQALSGGVLRGEEFNSIMEQAPRLARALADGLGVTTGELRRLANDGRLVTSAVLPALLSQLGQLKTEAASLPNSLSSATTQLGNSFSLLIGRADTAAGFTSALADQLSRVSAGLDRIRSRQDVLSLLGSVLTFNPTKSLFDGIAEAVRGTNSQELANRLSAGRASAGGGRGFLNPAEAFSPIALPPADKRSGRKDTVSEAQRYLESLQRQLEGTENLTAAETALRAIQSGRLSGATQALREQILTTAQQIDQATRQESQREAEKRQLEDLIDFRRQEAEAMARMLEQASQLSTRRLEAVLAEIAAAADANQALRDEIAIITGGELARRAIEKARLDSAIALKEDTLAMLQNAGASQAEIQALQQEIALLRERAGLLGKRNVALDSAGEAAEQLRLLTDVSRAIAGGFEEAIIGGRNLRGVLEGIGNDITRILTRKLITEPLANSITGLLGGFFADGGRPPLGRVSVVGEEGPELFIPDGPGTILSNSESRQALSGGGQRPISITNNFSIAGPVDRRTEEQIAAASGRGIREAASRWTAG